MKTMPEAKTAADSTATKIWEFAGQRHRLCDARKVACKIGVAPILPMSGQKGDARLIAHL